MKAHNFRNNKKGKKDEEGNVIRRSRYERLMEDIILGGKKNKSAVVKRNTCEQRTERP